MIAKALDKSQILKSVKKGTILESIPLKISAKVRLFWEYTKENRKYLYFLLGSNHRAEITKDIPQRNRGRWVLGASRRLLGFGERSAPHQASWVGCRCDIRSSAYGNRRE